MDLLGLINSSHGLVTVYTINFIITSYLVLLINIQIFDVTRNTPDGGALACVSLLEATYVR